MTKKNADSEQGPCPSSRDEPPVLSQKLVGVPPTTHTPGPWVWRGMSLCRSVDSDAPHVVIRQDRGTYGHHVGASAADRALIAAAPDLLAACEWALRVEEGGRPEGAWTPYVNALREAIAKARGTP